MPTYFARSDRIAFLYLRKADSLSSLSSSGVGVDSLEAVVSAALLDPEAVALEGKRPAFTSEANKLFKLVEIATEFAADAGAAEEGPAVPDFESTGCSE